jgi:hypothetical protein
MPPLCTAQEVVHLGTGGTPGGHETEEQAACDRQKRGKSQWRPDVRHVETAELDCRQAREDRLASAPFREVPHRHATSTQVTPGLEDRTSCSGA